MEALWLSMKLASCVATILLVIGMPVAYWLAYSNWRGKFLLESLVALPLVLPPTVLGFYALVAMGPRGPLGKLWIAIFGHGLAFTFGGLILASVLYSFPFAVQPLIASFEGVDRKLLGASAVLGAGGLRTFCRVILPLSLPGVVTAAVLSFAHTLGDYSGQRQRQDYPAKCPQASRTQHCRSAQQFSIDPLKRGDQRLHRKWKAVQHGGQNQSAERERQPVAEDR